jgi:hypothetical protein
VYAGAAREAVFSKTTVIQLINQDFIALSMNAVLVNGQADAGDPAERGIYERLRKAMLAPQGIGVLDSSGRVLEWVQTFDNDGAVLDFLDHSKKRFNAKASSAECYMTFPMGKTKDIEAESTALAIPDRHPEGIACTAESFRKTDAAKGSIVAHVYGRALDAAGRPLADTVRQEHYIQDHVAIDPDVQQEVARSLKAPGSGRVRIDRLGKLAAQSAYLGHLDSGPFLNSNKGEWKRCEFWAQKIEERDGVIRARIEGHTDVASTLQTTAPGAHNITLTWEGWIELKGDRIDRLLLLANGREKLEYGKEHHPMQAGRNEISVLPAGRPIDMECGVRYGIIGVPGTLDSSAVAHRGPNPDAIQRAIQRKMGQLGSIAERWQKEGRDVSPIVRYAQRIESLVKAGRALEAETVLDEALKEFGGK